MIKHETIVFIFIGIAVFFTVFFLRYLIFRSYVKGIRRWAKLKDYEILKIKYVWFNCSPFFLSGAALYRVDLKDKNGNTQKCWIRIFGKMVIKWIDNPLVHNSND